MTSVDIKSSFNYTVSIHMIPILQMREPKHGHTHELAQVTQTLSGGPGLGSSNFHVSKMEGFLL